MCCAITMLLKLAVTVVNAVLGIGFLLLALVGVLLKSSNSFVQRIVTAALNKAESEVTNVQAQELVRFIMDNTTAIAVILIMTGLVCAALCFVGCFAGCCGCSSLLKVYAIMLGILMIAKIIAISVVFSNEKWVTNFIVFSMKQLLTRYGNASDTSTVIWDLCMTVGDPCCGLDQPEDFKSYPILPSACCGGVDPCTNTSITVINNCRPKIVKFTYENMHIILNIFVAAILLEGALLLITVTAICLKAISPV